MLVAEGHHAMLRAPLGDAKTEAVIVEPDLMPLPDQGASGVEDVQALVGQQVVFHAAEFSAFMHVELSGTDAFFDSGRDIAEQRFGVDHHTGGVHPGLTHQSDHILQTIEEFRVFARPGGQVGV